MGNKKRKNKKYDNDGAIRTQELLTQDKRDIPPWTSHVQMSCVLGGVVLAVYVQTLYPSLPGGDSGELIAAAYELGVAHPPGYPLFTMLSWAAINLVPVGSIAWRVALFTALCGAGAAVMLSLAVLRLSNSLPAAIVSVGLFCFGRLAWTWSVTAEVFAMNNLFVGGLLVMTVWFEEAEKQNAVKISYIGAFMCGLSLCNQHTIVVYVVCIVAWVLTALCKQQVLTLKTFCVLGVFFLAGLIPYLYLPVSAYINNARSTWGDQTSLSGFLTHVLRKEYGTFDLGKDYTGLGLFYGLSYYLDHVQSELTSVGFVFTLGGVLTALYRSVRGEFVSSHLFLLMMTLYTVFFAWRSNLSLENQLFLGVVERFWMQTDIIVVMTTALAFIELYRCLCGYIAGLSVWKLDYVAAVLVLILNLRQNYSLCNQSNNTVVRDYAENLLTSLPPNSLVLTEGDISSNTLRYFYLCEGKRPDIQLFDQEVLTYEWSVAMMKHLYPGIEFPGDFLFLKTLTYMDGRKSFSFKHFLDVNYQRYPIFACIGVQDHEPSWQSDYELWPYGVCSQFIRKGSSLNLMEWSESSGAMARNWTYAVDGFDPKSWELVVSQEMWQAKISGAYFLYDRAETTENKEEKAFCLIYSYKLYTRAIESHSRLPSFWHRNYALVCQRLLYVSHNMDNVELLRKSIRHFSRYLAEEPTADDGDKIQQAVGILQQQLMSMVKGR